MSSLCKKTTLAIAAVLWVASAIAAPAMAAENYPSKMIHVIVPYPPGGSTDSLGRQLAARLSEKLGQQAIVENRSGGNNVIAANAVLSAAPDGHTFVINDLAMFAINPHLFSNLGYEPRKFSTVSLPTSFSFVFLVSPQNPANTLGEFLDNAKSGSKLLSYGSASIGNPTHLGMELLKSATGLQINHTPYKGGGPALNDLMGNHIDAALMDIPGSIPYIQSGKLKALAVTSPDRHPRLPDVPTIAEEGWPDAQFTGWNGIAVRSDTPDDIKDRLNVIIREVVAEDAFNEWLQNMTVTPDGRLGTAQVEERVRLDAERLGGLVKELNLTID
ncbi:MAG: tripartite tricarboxylate transporter substrate binding protein [Pusillimonas sp.]